MCNNNCKICHFILNGYFLKVNNFVVPFLCDSNCDAENIVYIIICKKCSVFYIGEKSKSLIVRISQHLNGVKRFVPYTKTENEVADHFRRKGHIINEHFKVCVLQKNLLTTQIRRNIEKDLINLFIYAFNASVLNSKIYNIHNFKQLSFV
ncbi:unnamed protein product [Brachionus calyciflorus]|uniref:GIY-YIG domain-containing protein n=1 Tax=Brachionus calyciflorus TaxID=104777 RepID=A0A813V9R2_9BILA|nr:unnamed protein product [Brachionus calyciflorus]